MSNLNTFYKTFSGSDAVAFLIFPQSKPILLGSLSTISHSVYREKKPVPLLGKINTGGYTRGMRSIAGTMVFTLVNQHLVEDLKEQIPYLEAHGKLKADELPFFDIMVVCANEYGAASQLYIYGAEFYEDGQVISVQDIYIENTFSFVARDIDDFSRINPIVQSGALGSNYTVETLVGYAFSKSDYDDLYSNAVSSKAFSSDKLKTVQAALKADGYEINLNGIADNETVIAIKDFQSKNKLNATGELTDATYDLLTDKDSFIRNAAMSQLEETLQKVIIQIQNKNGAYVYSNTDKDSIIGITKYLDDYTGYDCGEFVKITFYGNTGYIAKEDTKAPVSSIILDYDEKTESGKIYSYYIDEFNPDLIGASVKVKSDVEFRISGIAYFKNNASLFACRYYKLSAGDSRDLLLSYLSTTFIYNMEHKSIPLKVDFIITPVGGTSIKWTVKLKER